MFISRLNLAPEAVNEELADIERACVARNARLSITGALLLNGEQFAQVMEGPPQSVSDVMTLIRADTRHSDVVVVDECKVSEPRFPNWSIVAIGKSAFVKRILDECLEVPVRPDSRSNLFQIFEEFATA